MLRMTRCFLVLFSAGLLSCGRSDTQNQDVVYSSSSDSAMLYYHWGWQQIMDEGRYAAAEVSYRKVLDFDSSFLLGKSVLARLSLDLEERLALYRDVEKAKGRIYGSERKILDVYQALVYFTNVREQQPEQTEAVLNEALALAETYLREVVHQHPGEVYLKAEYLEVLHSRHGAQAALDSLDELITSEQLDNPFLLGYAASMLAELGEFDEAIDRADRLENVLGDSLLPKPYVVYADIYLAMDSLQKAKAYADRAVELDFRNLDATRLQARIDKAVHQ